MFDSHKQHLSSVRFFTERVSACAVHPEWGATPAALDARRRAIGRARAAGVPAFRIARAANLRVRDVRDVPPAR